MSERILCLIMGYVCGLLQTSYLYGRLNHIDIREYGSGNAGTTNALRTLGMKAGIVTFAGDFFKPMAAGLIAWLIFRSNETVRLLQLYAGVGAVLGHIFPCYLGFRGGKGVATIAGMSVLFSILNGFWYVIAALAVVFVAVVAVTRYVSLGSMIIITIYYFWVIVLGQMGTLGWRQENLYEMYVVMGIYSIIAIFKHRANIVRLVHGEENKIFQKKEK